MKKAIGNILIDSKDNNIFHLTQLNVDATGLDEIVLTKEQLLDLKEIIEKVVE